MARELTWAAARFAILARHLEATGETGFRDELWKAVGDAASPAVESVRASMPDYMPDPYAAVLDPDLQLAITRSAYGHNPGVRIIGSNRTVARKLHRLERGILTHPLFGNRDHWYNQASHVVKGFFAEPIRKQQPQIKEQIRQALNRVAAQTMRNP